MNLLIPYKAGYFFVWMSNCCLLKIESAACNPDKLFFLMMEAASTVETSVNFFLTTHHNNPSVSHFQTIVT
jgi:hypothetical protein